MTTVAFKTRTFRSTITRPANTTTYAAEDVISSATSTVFVLGLPVDADTPIDQVNDPVFPNTDNHSVSLDNLVLTSGSNPTLGLDGELWFFTVNPATRVDNAIKSFTLAEMRDSFITAMSFAKEDWLVANAGVDAAGIQTLVFPNIDWPEQSPAFDATIYKGQVYVVLIAKNAYVPVTGQVFSLKGTFTCD